MKKNMEYFREVLEQLCNMFGKFSYDEIKTICEERHWNVDRCVDHLVKISAEVSYHSEHKKGALPKHNFFNTRTKYFRENSPAQNSCLVKEQVIAQAFQNGYKIMILMRGAPGSGKTFLATELLKKGIYTHRQYCVEDFIFSTDDFFVQLDGSYKHNINVEDAHIFNQRRVLEKAQSGWSPIIIDNTNMQLWEMLPYSQIAVEYGYLIEILEPNTAWQYLPQILCLKNKHGVSKEKIEAMLNCYEKCTVGDLIKMLKFVKYQVPLPQIRSNPPIETGKLSPTWNFKDVYNEKITFCNEIRDNNSLRENLIFTYYQKIQNSMKSVRPDSDFQNKISANKLLPEGISNRKEIFQRHSFNCANENTSFLSLRQMYPNKETTELWDLFVKCNGDINWVVENILKEDELSKSITKKKIASKEKNICNCYKGNISHSTESGSKLSSSSKLTPADQHHNSLQLKPNVIVEFEQAKKGKQICCIAEEQGLIENKSEISTNLFTPTLKSSEESITLLDTQKNLKGFESERFFNSKLIELSFNEDFIQQLHGIFKNEVSTYSSFLVKKSTKVFIPRHLAKELYLLCIEASHSHKEQERHKIIQDDENFARLIKLPKYENYTSSPINIHTILYNEISRLNINNNKDISTRISQTELNNMYPNSCAGTVKCHETVQKKFCDEKNVSGENNSVNDGENEILNCNDFGDFSLTSRTRNSVQSSSKQTTLTTDEAKRLALYEFEETRNLAAHHSQLRAECYQKAKNAIQNGNSSVAVYYSQIANLHKKKIDMYNHRAANCIVDVHKYTLNNPDLLDLHYLHLMEAISCLDVFLDNHITKLRAISRICKYVYIITGRGLHSASGVSTIKNKVKSRLKERNLRWSEVNPGLLKVKIFSASRHSKNY